MLGEVRYIVEDKMILSYCLLLARKSKDFFILYFYVYILQKNIKIISLGYKKGIFVHFFLYFIGVRHMHATQPKTISFGHFYIFSYIFVDWNDLDL